MAVSAATRDPRFAAVTEEELDHLVIEISVLGQRQRVHSIAEVQIGTHGLSIELGSSHGLLLPQVATEASWDAETFLGKVCQKAGLSPDDWRNPDAIVEAFTAQVFNEKTHAPKPRTPTPPS
jgi:AmmeMemoRadiSam system protein A